MTAEVRLIGPDGTTWTVPPGRTTIGRAEGSAILLPNEDDLASRRHAHLEHADGTLRIVDDGSTNGVHVGDRRIDGAATLAHGDRVRLGATTFRVDAPGLVDPRRTRADDDPPPTASARHRIEVDRRLGRMRVLLLATLTVAVFATAVAVWMLASRSEGPEAADRRIADRAAAATVLIRSGSSAEPGRTTGSGIVVDARAGLILTNAHVVAAGPRIQIGSTEFGGASRSARLVAAAPCQDLALVRVDDPHGLKPAVLADRPPRQGDHVLAAGYPRTPSLRLDYQVYPGTVTVAQTSLDSPGENQPRLAPVIQHDAAIGAGASGGPLLDRRGHVVGVDAATSAEVAGQSFAIPAATARRLLPALRAGRGPWWSGAVLAEAPEGGVEVVAVSPSSAAARAAVRPGDVVTEISGAGRPANLVELCDVLSDRSAAELGFGTTERGTRTHVQVDRSP